MLSLFGLGGSRKKSCKGMKRKSCKSRRNSKRCSWRKKSKRSKGNCARKSRRSRKSRKSHKGNKKKSRRSRRSRKYKKKGGSNLNKSKLFSQYTVQELKDVLIDSLSHNHPNYDFLVSSINNMNKTQLKNQLKKRLRRTGAPNAISIENAMDIVSRNPDPFTNTMLPSAPSAPSPRHSQIPEHLRLRRSNARINY